MATTDKPIALQTDMQKTTTSFESFLTPEEAQAVEEQLEAQEEVVEEEELEEMMVDNKISVSCEFCKRLWNYDPKALSELRQG